MICLFEYSTCFDQPCAHPREDNCINTTSGIIHSVLEAVRWIIPDVLIQLSSRGWAQSCSKHVEDSNKHTIEETVSQVGYPLQNTLNNVQVYDYQIRLEFTALTEKRQTTKNRRTILFLIPFYRQHMTNAQYVVSTWRIAPKLRIKNFRIIIQI